MSERLINGKWQRPVVCRSCGWVGERRSSYTKPCPKCSSGRVELVTAGRAALHTGEKE